MEPMTLLQEYDALCLLGQASDKGSAHSYIPFYEELFAPYRSRKVRVLEIGAQYGWSLALWARFFDDADVIGVDTIDYGTCDNPIGFSVIHGDATDPEVLADAGDFDIIIDDGSHSDSDVLAAFVLLKTRVKDGGVYVIEDIQHDGIVGCLKMLAEFEEVDLRHVKGRSDDRLMIWRGDGPKKKLEAAPDRNPTFLFSTKPNVTDVQPNIVVPYSNATLDSAVHKAVRLNFQVQGLRPRYERMDGTLDSDFAYDRFFRSIWAEGESFIIVEHDILPWPGATQQLWGCPEPWCGFPYMVKGSLNAYLGCVKFDPSRLGECPLPDEALLWSKLDMQIITRLSERGFHGHLHEPAVVHLNYGHQRITSPEGIIRPDWMNQ